MDGLHTRVAFNCRMLARKRSRREGGMKIDYLSLETTASPHPEGRQACR
ncbi:hypothetical protein [Burkholderia stabilis]|nr:hypothetical protein [Burkholderia stabilis]